VSNSFCSAVSIIAISYSQAFPKFTLTRHA